MPDDVLQGRALRPVEANNGDDFERWWVVEGGPVPGPVFGYWRDVRAQLEPYRGFSGANRGWVEAIEPNTSAAAFGFWAKKLDRLRRQEEAPAFRIRALNPPPRPSVHLQGPHFWAVYIGRQPGIYYSA